MYAPRYGARGESRTTAVSVMRCTSKQERLLKPTSDDFSRVTVVVGDDWLDTLADFKQLLKYEFRKLDVEMTTVQQSEAYYIQAYGCTVDHCVCNKRKGSMWLGSSHVLDARDNVCLKDPHLDGKTLKELGFIPGDHGLVCVLVYSDTLIEKRDAANQAAADAAKQAAADAVIVID